MFRTKAAISYSHCFLKSRFWMLQCYYSIQEMRLLMDFLWFLVIPDKNLAVPLHTASFLLQILKWEDILRREKLDFSQSSPPPHFPHFHYLYLCSVTPKLLQPRLSVVNSMRLFFGWLSGVCVCLKIPTACKCCCRSGFSEDTCVNQVWERRTTAQANVNRLKRASRCLFSLESHKIMLWRKNQRRIPAYSPDSLF